MSFFKETADRYESELLNSVVPFWEQHSIDSEYGGFLTCLERDGTVYDTNKYMWMQWREVYLFAVLYNSVFSQKRYLDYAVDGFNFLTHSGLPGRGSPVLENLLEQCQQVGTETGFSRRNALQEIRSLHDRAQCPADHENGAPDG